MHEPGNPAESGAPPLSSLAYPDCSPALHAAAAESSYPGSIVNYLGGAHMLKWAIIFAIISLVAGVLGFTGVASGAAGIAKILFYIFIVVAVIFVVLALLGIGAVA
jgi:uncharacterized membrane protein YtjA (UPF0391 family)